mgnify:CR=1 FL=1
MAESLSVDEYTNKIYDEMLLQAETFSKPDVAKDMLDQYKIFIKHQVSSVLAVSENKLGTLIGDVRVKLNDWSNDFGLISFSFGTEEMFQGLDVLDFTALPTIGLWNPELYTGENGGIGVFEVPIDPNCLEFVQTASAQIGLKSGKFTVTTFGKKNSMVDCEVKNESNGIGAHLCLFVTPESSTAQVYDGVGPEMFVMNSTF